jgi:hypothetical protein
MSSGPITDIADFISRQPIAAKLIVLGVMTRAVERRRRRARLITRRRRRQWVGEIGLRFALFVVAMVGALAFSPPSASVHRSRAVAREFQREALLPRACQPRTKVISLTRAAW